MTNIRFRPSYQKGTLSVIRAIESRGMNTESALVVDLLDSLDCASQSCIEGASLLLVEQ